MVRNKNQAILLVFVPHKMTSSAEENFGDKTSSELGLTANESGSALTGDLYEDYYIYIKDRECVDVNEYQLLKFNIDDKTSHLTVRILFGFVYSTIFAFGLFGNGGVMGVVARNRKLQNARNIFLLSLMASDLLLCLTAVVVTPFAAIEKKWMFGPFLCKLVPLSQSMSVLITSWTLASIAVDKYVHIRDATKGPIKLSRALVIIICIWIISCAVNIPYMLSYELIDGSAYVQNSTTEKPFCGQFCDEIGWKSDMHRMIYGTSILGLQFVVPMIIISFCYIRIFGIVRRDMIAENSNFANSLSVNQRFAAIRRKRRVNYILIAMVGAFMFAWFPLNLINILRDFARLPMFILDQRYLWALIVHSMAMTTVIWNPVLFYWLTRKRKRKTLELTRTGVISKNIVEASLSVPAGPCSDVVNKIRRTYDSAKNNSSVQSELKKSGACSLRACKGFGENAANNGSIAVTPWHQADTAPSPRWQPKVAALRSLQSHSTYCNHLQIPALRSVSVEPVGCCDYSAGKIESTPLIPLSNGQTANGTIGTFRERSLPCYDSVTSALLPLTNSIADQNLNEQNDVVLFYEMTKSSLC